MTPAMTAAPPTGSPATPSPPADPWSNDVQARFGFADGLIADHVDDFDFRRWAGQALGPKGHLVALLPPLRSRARAEALDRLATYKREETGSSI